MRVDLPDALTSVGVVDLRDYDVGLVDVHTDADGTAYIDVPEGIVDQVRQDYEQAHDMDYDDPTAAVTEDDVCGYADETMDSPCNRPAGWGRDTDTGYCQDHAEAS